MLAQIIVERFLRSSHSHDYDLTIYDCMLLQMLASYCGGKHSCWPSIDRLGKDCRMSRRSVLNSLKKLEQKSLIIKASERGKVNHYSINVPVDSSELSFGIQVEKQEKLSTTQALDAPHPCTSCTPTQAPDAPEYSHINILKNNKDIMSTSSQLSDAQPPLPDKILTKRKIEEEFRETAKKVIDFLNEKVGRNYRHTEANLKLIISRLKSGATFIDCKQVIVKKRREWINDAKMNEYLRPATLFNATKFEQYLGELVAVY